MCKEKYNRISIKKMKVTKADFSTKNVKRIRIFFSILATDSTAVRKTTRNGVIGEILVKERRGQIKQSFKGYM